MYKTINVNNGILKDIFHKWRKHRDIKFDVIVEGLCYSLISFLMENLWYHHLRIIRTWHLFQRQAVSMRYKENKQMLILCCK